MILKACRLSLRNSFHGLKVVFSCFLTQFPIPISIKDSAVKKKKLTNMLNFVQKISVHIEKF
jgi:hypothetical protein